MTEYLDPERKKNYTQDYMGEVGGRKDVRGDGRKEGRKGEGGKKSRQCSQKQNKKTHSLE